MYRNSHKGGPIDESSNINGLYKQRSNRKLLGLLPYVNIYNFGKLFYDTVKISDKKKKIEQKFDLKIRAAELSTTKSKLMNKKERKIKKKDLALSDGNSFMRSLGEAPVIFDSSKVKSTILSMKAFLFSKGFFHNKVTAKIDTTGQRIFHNKITGKVESFFKRKRISVTYFIETGKPFIIDHIIYNIKDSRIDSIINKTTLLTKSIKKNEQYDEKKIDTERDNIFKLLRDQGYFYFQKYDIVFDIDTLHEPYKLDITVIIEGKHEVYRVSKLYFNINDIQNSENHKLDTFQYKNVHYTYYKKSYMRKLLDYKISIRPFDVYNQSKFQMTQRALGSLDIYKFVNINLEPNKEDTIHHTLTGYINTQPSDKFQVSQEYGLSIGQALVPGPFASFTLKTRNIFKWLEVIENTFRYTLEAQYTNTNQSEPYKAREFSAYSSFSLSQLLIPSPLRDIFKKYNPKVKFYIGFNSTKRPEYTRNTLKAGLTYSYTRNAYSSFFITPIEASYIDSRIDQAYNHFLDSLHTANGSNLFRSFKPSIVTDFQISYIYNNHSSNSTKVTKYFRPSFEFGGLVPTLIANKFGTPQDRDSSRLFGKQIYQYLRFAMDLRYYIPIVKKTSLVVRFNLGYALPIGNSGKDEAYLLPYEKYFFTGGNSSNRAWKPRRLGPGAYN
ncbi:MAG TPA: hypothetical protein VK766_04345, partial [Cytophagaceae bacterium]|nr:hypothetical protein [Cytophagaceae bacterium]